MKQIKNIIFMGTSEFAVPTLEELVKQNLSPKLVITQPDRRSGRGRKISSSPIKRFSQTHDLIVYQPKKLNNPVIRDKLKQYNPDIILAIAYGKFIGKKILNMPKFGCINVHPSLLPKYRGPSPINWTLFEGEEETGNTIFYMSRRMDAGDIIHQSKITINEDDNYGTLSEKLSKQAAFDVISTLKAIEKEEVNIIPQNEDKATYSKLIDRNLRKINWEKSAMEIANKIKGLAPKPAAFSYLNNKYLKILKARVLNKNSNASPGKIIEIVKNKGFVVNTGKGLILIETIKPEGKKEMSSYSFSLGQEILGKKFRNE